MYYLQILFLAIIQGLAELLPVSSSAHVIVAEKLMRLDPSSPEMTMLLLMLHTGTMAAVIVYFWKRWQRDYLSSPTGLKDFVAQLVVGTVCTVAVGLALIKVIEKVFLHDAMKAEIESLFSNLTLIGIALMAVGLLILIAGFRTDKRRIEGVIQMPHAVWIGVIQGLCLPFRGFSRSGSTISMGLLFGLSRQRVEEFSFALGVLITPLGIAREGMRLLKANHAGAHLPLGHLLAPSPVGMVFSFGAGLVALRWLSNWLEAGQWKFFGFYCLAASAAVLGLHFGMGL